jgi:hypothetical protein
MGDIQDWSVTDASNIDLWPENMRGGQINDSGRAMQGVLARWFEDTNGSITASGSSNAFSATSKRTIGALSDALRISFKANHSITGSATLNLNGIGATAIKRWNGSATAQGDIVSGQIVDLVYASSLSAWLMMSVPAALIASTHADLGENASPGDPAADVARLYAKDVGGVTRLAYRDSAGTERILDRAGEIIAIIENQQTSGTAADVLTEDTDVVRTLNTLAYNRDTLVSLSSNRFTLPAGTWEIAWEAPVGGSAIAASHQSFLYNQTDATEVARGMPGFVDHGSEDVGDATYSSGRAVVTIAASKAFEVRHRINNSSGTVRQGDAASLGTEVYTRVTVRRA